MTNKEKIQKICTGKSLRVFSSQTDDPSVTFVESYRNCGKKKCSRCRKKSGRPHGPYWTLNYTDDGGRIRTMYVGKELPEIAHHPAVSFADVIRFYREGKSNRETIGRYQEELKRSKKEIERLFEELTSLRKASRQKAPQRAEKFFRHL